MMRDFLFAAALVALPASSSADGNCAERDVIVAALSGRFGESLRSIAPYDENRVLEMWANPATGSWTTLMTFSDGTSCITMEGQGWTTAPQPPKGDPL